MKKYVIFDLDGTLLNTIEDLGNSTNLALERLGFPTHGMWVYPTLVGSGVNKLLERSLPEEERNEATVAKLRAEFISHYQEHCCDMTKPYPGMSEIVEELSVRGVGLAVTSNKYEGAVTKIVEHFFPKGNWKAVLGHVEGMKVKPDPSIVFKALSMYPTAKSECLYVGDSGIDIETARRACIESVGVTWGFRPILELRESHADHIISDPGQLLGLAGITAL